MAQVGNRFAEAKMHLRRTSVLRLLRGGLGLLLGLGQLRLHHIICSCRCTRAIVFITFFGFVSPKSTPLRIKFPNACVKVANSDSAA
jgi:hypothetical protein